MPTPRMERSPGIEQALANIINTTDSTEEQVEFAVSHAIATWNQVLSVGSREWDFFQATMVLMGISNGLITGLWGLTNERRKELGDKVEQDQLIAAASLMSLIHLGTIELVAKVPGMYVALEQLGFTDEDYVVEQATAVGQLIAHQEG
jgi:hypothetical protein